MASRGTWRAPGLAMVLAGVLAALLLPAWTGGAQDEYAGLRHLMVEEQIRARDVADPQVLAAMEQVPRHLFVPEPQRDRIEDHAIGEEERYVFENNKRHGRLARLVTHVTVRDGGGTVPPSREAAHPRAPVRAGVRPAA